MESKKQHCSNIKSTFTFQKHQVSFQLNKFIIFGLLSIFLHIHIVRFFSIYIYIYIYIYIHTHIHEEIWHPNTFDRQQTIVVSKNYRMLAGREAVSLTHPLSLQGEIGMWGPHSLLAIYVSMERQTPWPYLVLRKSPPPKKNVANFQTTEDKLVAMWSSKDLIIHLELA